MLIVYQHSRSVHVQCTCTLLLCKLCGERVKVFSRRPCARPGVLFLDRSRGYVQEEFCLHLNWKRIFEIHHREFQFSTASMFYNIDIDIMLLTSTFNDLCISYKSCCWSTYHPYKFMRVLIHSPRISISNL